MTVHAVVGDVELSADEPLRNRRPGPVQHLGEGVSQLSRLACSAQKASRSRVGPVVQFSGRVRSRGERLRWRVQGGTSVRASVMVVSVVTTSARWAATSHRSPDGSFGAANGPNVRSAVRCDAVSADGISVSRRDIRKPRPAGAAAGSARRDRCGGDRAGPRWARCTVTAPICVTGQSRPPSRPSAAPVRPPALDGGDRTARRLRLGRPGTGRCAAGRSRPWRAAPPTWWAPGGGHRCRR